MIDPERLDFGLDAKVALVTGASRNIGRAVAVALSAAGARVGLVARTRSELLTGAVAACARNNPAHGVVANLGDPAALQAAVDEVETALGPVDVLVNNAALRPRVPIAEITLGDWDEVMAVNARAPFLLVQRVLPGMLERRWGRIVNISGSDALSGSVDRVHVTTSKAALLGLTAALTPQVAKYGVTVNTVVPGAVDTQRHSPEWYPELQKFYSSTIDRIPMARFGSPDEIANVVLFAASNLGSFVTGQTLNAAGGYPIVRKRENEAEPDLDWAAGRPEAWRTGLVAGT